MGLLDSILGGFGGGQAQAGGGGTSPVVKALLLLLAAKAASSYMSHNTGGAAAPAPTPSPGDGTIQTGILKGMPGLDAILDKFRGAGLGSAVDSWIGHGANTPVQPGDVQKALGSDLLAKLEQETGMSSDQLAGQLSSALPQIIDKLTPNGHLPAPQDRGHW